MTDESLCTQNLPRKTIRKLMFAKLKSYYFHNTTKHKNKEVIDEPWRHVVKLGSKLGDSKDMQYNKLLQTSKQIYSAAEAAMNIEDNFQ